MVVTKLSRIFLGGRRERLIFQFIVDNNENLNYPELELLQHIFRK